MSDSGPPRGLLLDINVQISHGKFNTKIYDKRDDFSFPIVNYTFLDGDVPLAPSYGVYISQPNTQELVLRKISFF